MSHPPQDSLRNQLLRLTAAEEYELLRPHLEPVPLERTLVLFKPGQIFEWAYFPDDGVASLIKNTTDGRRLEVGLFGRDGMGSMALALGADSTPLECLIQVEGRGHRIAAGTLRAALAKAPGLNALLLRYAQAFTVQVAQTALSNGGYTIEERLARWLLLTHDRLDGDDLPLTHEFLAVMLGVRRPGVTVATHVLEGLGAIRARRGMITVLDRSKLEELAGDAYGPAETEFERLVGPLRKIGPTR